MAPGSPPRNRIQKPWLTTATARSPAAISSAPNMVPRAGPVPNTWKKSAVTRRPWTWCACSSTSTVRLTGNSPPTASNTSVRVRSSWYSTDAEAEVGDVAVVAVGPRPHDPLRRVIRQRVEQDGFHHGEDGRGGPDAQGQRSHRHYSEARRPAKLPERIPNVLNQSFHIPTPSRWYPSSAVDPERRVLVLRGPPECPDRGHHLSQVPQVGTSPPALVSLVVLVFVAQVVQ